MFVLSELSNTQLMISMQKNQLVIAEARRNRTRIKRDPVRLRFSTVNACHLLQNYSYKSPICNSRNFVRPN